MEKKMGNFAMVARTKERAKSTHVVATLAMAFMVFVFVGCEELPDESNTPMAISFVADEPTATDDIRTSRQTLGYGCELSEPVEGYETPETPTPCSLEALPEDRRPCFDEGTFECVTHETLPGVTQCVYETADDETIPLECALGGGESDPETDCNDGVDNNGDGMVDGADPTCQAEPCTVEEPRECHTDTGIWNNAVCVQIPLEDGAACDTLFCMVGQTCTDGVCGDGTPYDCNDEFFCNGAETCNEELNDCVSGAPVDCSAESGACTIGECDEDLDDCAGTPIEIGTSCDLDSSVCTVDQCDGAGTCENVGELENELELVDDQCQFFAACHPTLGYTVQSLPDGVPCTEGTNLCTRGDSCQAGACTAGTELEDCEDDNVCTDNGECDPGTGECSAATNNTAPCDDEDLCTTDDVCGGGSCAGSAVVCPDDGDACTDPGVCDPATGACSDSMPTDAAMACSDSSTECSTNTCDPDSGICELDVDVTVCDEGTVCQTPLCGDEGCILMTDVGCCIEDDECACPDGETASCTDNTCECIPPDPECVDDIDCDSCPAGSTGVCTDGMCECSEDPECTVDDECACPEGESATCTDGACGECEETEVETSCTNGEDDDGDGVVDCLDTDCSADDACDDVFVFTYDCIGACTMTYLSVAGDTGCGDDCPEGYRFIRNHEGSIEDIEGDSEYFAISADLLALFGRWWFDSHVDFMPCEYFGTHPSACFDAIEDEGMEMSDYGWYDGVRTPRSVQRVTGETITDCTINPYGSVDDRLGYVLTGCTAVAP